VLDVSYLGSKIPIAEVLLALLRVVLQINSAAVHQHLALLRVVLQINSAAVHQQVHQHLSLVDLPEINYHHSL